MSNVGAISPNLDAMIQREAFLEELGYEILDPRTQKYFFKLLYYHIKALKAIRHIRQHRSQVRLHINGESHVMYQINFTEKEAREFDLI